MSALSERLPRTVLDEKNVDDGVTGFRTCHTTRRFLAEALAELLVRSESGNGATWPALQVDIEFAPICFHLPRYEALTAKPLPCWPCGTHISNTLRRSTHKNIKLSVAHFCADHDVIVILI